MQRSSGRMQGLEALTWQPPFPRPTRRPQQLEDQPHCSSESFCHHSLGNNAHIYSPLCPTSGARNKIEVRCWVDVHLLWCVRPPCTPTLFRWTQTLALWGPRHAEGTADKLKELTMTQQHRSSATHSAHTETPRTTMLLLAVPFSFELFASKQWSHNRRLERVVTLH
eukprot:2038968-Rhodomonas_salina.1